MFISYENLKKFIKILELLKKFNDIVSFEFLKDKIVINLLDSAQVCYTYLTFTQNFLTYSNEDEYKINKASLEISNLLKMLKYILKNINEHNNVQLTFEQDKLFLYFLSNSFSINLINYETDAIELMLFNHQFSFSVDSIYFLNVLEGLSLGGENDICFELENKELYLNSSNDMLSSSLKVNYEDNVDKLFNNLHLKSNKLCIYYSFKFFIRCITLLTEKINISVDQNNPLHVNYLDKDNFSIDLFLAPKLIDEDEDYDDMMD